MAQFKIYGRDEWLAPNRAALSDVIHACAVETLGLPAGKRFHRFIRLSPDDFVHPPDRTARYTIIEVLMFEGRDVAVRKALIRGLIARLAERFGLSPGDIEITLIETPRANWGIRGLPGDELVLDYTVEKRA